MARLVDPRNGRGRVRVTRRTGRYGMKVKVYENTHPPGKHAGEVYQTGVGWMPAASKLRPFRSSSKSKPSGSGGLTTRQLQQRLRRHGYNVAVDASWVRRRGPL